MNKPLLLVLSFLALLSVGRTSKADITVDVLGDHELIFEALIQADANRFNNDFDRVDSAALTPAQITSQTFLNDNDLRRGEMILRGKSPTDDWSIAYEARANRWLDLFYRSRFGSFATWRVGQFKQPNSLEELVSTRHNDFVAKAQTTSAFAMARRLGVELATGDNHWAVQATVFGNELKQPGNRASKGLGVRYAYAPLYQVNETFETEQVLHLGVSALRFEPGQNRLRLNPRPEADLANIRLIDTLTLGNLDQAAVLGVEAAYFRGPLKIQYEYMDANYTRTTNPDYSPESWYVSAVYNLTGEKFTYRTGMYQLPLPADPSGLWQVGLRHSYLNANSAGVSGGKQAITTVGVNWYWRSNFKFMANYSLTDSKRTTFNNDPNVLELRAQVIF